MTLDLSLPRRPYVDLFLDGDWRPVISDVRQTTPIKIERGRKNEAARPAPGKCTFVLDDGPRHGDGDYSPRNPLGQWYGHLARNAPVRVGLEVGQDVFARTEVSGWGTSPANGAWTTTGINTFATSVAPGAAQHSVTSTTSYALSYLAGVQVRDIDVSVSVALNKTDITGGALEPANLILRGQSTSSYYMVRLTITASESMALSILLNDSSTIAGPVALPDTYTGQQMRIRAAMEQGHIMAKAWPAAGGEPLDWQVDTVRPTPLGAGWVGIRSGVSGANSNTKPILFDYSDFELRLPRFAGEVANLTPSTNLPHTERSVKVECGGLLRRVQKYDKALDSAVRRFVDRADTFTPVEYWPLEETVSATIPGASAFPGGATAEFTRGVDAFSQPIGSIKWGVAPGIPSVAGAVEISNGALLTLPVRPRTDLSAGWSVAWGQRLSSDIGGRVWLRTTTPANDIYLIFYTDGTYEVYRVTTTSGELLLTGSFPLTGFDDVWHTFAFSSHDIGSGQAGYNLLVDDQIVGTASASVATHSLLDRVEFYVDPGTAPGAYSHVVVFPEDIDAIVGDFSEYHYQFFGRAGEPVFDQGRDTAGERFVRLCTEEGIPHAWTGDLANSPMMGPQTPTTIGRLLQECIDVDQGSLYEPRSLRAMAIRTTSSLYAQTSRVVLDYSNGEIAPEFGPVEDDLDPVNDVTAKRTYGDQARYEQTTGPMNVSDPGTALGAVGRYDTSVTVNVESDSQVLDAAAWRVHLGTVDEPRFPTITVDLSASTVATQPVLLARLLDLNVDDFLTVTNLESTLIYDDVRQIVRGYTEVFDTQYRHLLTYNTSPASPYDVAVLDAATARLDSDTSLLQQDIDADDVTFVVTTAGGTWTTDVSHFPFDVLIGGERCTVTGIVGTGFTVQDFTVTRAVNGVSRAWSSGTKVSLADPYYLGL